MPFCTFPLHIWYADLVVMIRLIWNVVYSGGMIIVSAIMMFICCSMRHLMVAPSSVLCLAVLLCGMHFWAASLRTLTYSDVRRCCGDQAVWWRKLMMLLCDISTVSMLRYIFVLWAFGRRLQATIEPWLTLLRRRWHMLRVIFGNGGAVSAFMRYFEKSVHLQFHFTMFTRHLPACLPAPVFGTRWHLFINVCCGADVLMATVWRYVSVFILALKYSIFFRWWWWRHAAHICHILPCYIMHLSSRVATRRRIFLSVISIDSLYQRAEVSDVEGIERKRLTATLQPSLTSEKNLMLNGICDCHFSREW